MPLPQETITSATAGAWIVDNDSQNAFNLTTRYVVFNIVQGKTSDPINIYGQMMRIERLSSANQREFYSIACAPTQMAPSNFDANTYFPNGNKEPSVVDGELQETWMRAKTPPKPPVCVPTDYNYCPAPSSEKRSR